MANSFELGRFECLVTEVHKMAVANCSKLLLRNCGSKQRCRWDIRVCIRKVLLHIGGAIRIFIFGYCPVCESRKSTRGTQWKLLHV